MSLHRMPPFDPRSSTPEPKLSELTFDHLLTPLEDLPTPATGQPLDGRCYDSEAVILGTLPSAPTAPTLHSQVSTPLHDPLFDNPGILSSMVPSSADLPSPPINKLERNLRLPSFDSLGIANPHPDKLSSMPSFDEPFLSPLSTSIGGINPLPPQDSSTPPLSTPSLSPDYICPGLRAAVRLPGAATPPEDPERIDWAVHPEAVAASASRSPALALRAKLQRTISEQSSVSSPEQDASKAGNAPRHEPSWLREVLDIIVENVADGGPKSRELRMVSQALPTPALTGHIYPTLITALHQRLQPWAIRWVNVLHAVPGSMNLSELPRSPPSTPAPPHESEDYFAVKVFDSAVAVPDYQVRDPEIALSPKPAVTPGSVNLSIVERYIPPTSSQEFSELFFEHGHSILSDRLLELSTKDGILLFIYPTKTGGHTFVRDYLGPIMDPVLRRLMISESLHTSLLAELSAMPAADELVAFEDMHARMEAFCAQLSTPTENRLHSGSIRPSRVAPTSAPMDSTPVEHQPARYSLIHASKRLINLDKEAWGRQWWAKQEKPRMRRAVAEYLSKNNSTRKSADGNFDVPIFAGYELVETILNGVTSYKYAQPPEAGQSNVHNAEVPSSPATMRADVYATSPTSPARSTEDMAAFRKISEMAALSRSTTTASVHTLNVAPRLKLTPPTVGIEVGVFVLKKSALEQESRNTGPDTINKHPTAEDSDSETSVGAQS